jgi:glycosyltransferase involved in cell wall biosynthesis
MRVCMMTSEIPQMSQGGVGHYVWELSRMLKQTGHEVTILTRGSWKSPERTVVQGITVYKIPYIPLYPFHAELHGVFAGRFLRLLAKRFDIVHMHLPLVSRAKTSIPVVVTVHSLPEIHSAALSSAKVRLFSPFLLWTERSVVNAADIVTTVSEFVADEVRKHLFAEGMQGKIAVIGSGVDHDFFRPAQDSASDPYVLYVGRLSPEKGVEDIIRSAGYVHSQYSDVRFILIGSGPLEQHIRKMATRDGIGGSFTFIRRADKASLRWYYSNARLFLLPSYYEGLPLSLLEAMSCGAPVVATEVGGTGEVVRQGENGYLVRPGDPQALAQAMMHLISNPRLGKEFGRNGRRRIIESFNWEKVLERLIACYIAAIDEGLEHSAI